MARAPKAEVTRVIARVTIMGGDPLNPVVTAPGEAVDMPADEAERLVASGQAVLPNLPAKE